MIGVDTDGADHRVDATNDTVFVTRGTGAVLQVEQIERLGPRILTEWIAYVDQERGWIDCWLDATNLAEATRRKRAAREAADR